MRRAQLTIFFTIGLVLVIVVLLLIYTRINMSETESEGATTTESDQYLAQCIENAIYNFLDDLAEPILALNGTESYTNHTNFTMPKVREGTTTYIEAIGNDEAIYEATFFGRNQLPPLCDPAGPNNNGQTDNPHCGPYAYGTNSLQERLANKLTNAMNDCTTTDVDEALGVDYADYGTATTTVRIGAQALTTTTLFENDVELTQTTRVRLLPLYNYANERLVLATRDPRQTIDDDQTSQHYRNGFTITRTELPNTYRYSFTDTTNTYDGRQLSITFLADQRQPYTDSDGTMYDLDAYTP